MSSKTIWTGVRGALSARARAVSAGAAREFVVEVQPVGEGVDLQRGTGAGGGGEHGVDVEIDGRATAEDAGGGMADDVDVRVLDGGEQPPGHLRGCLIEIGVHRGDQDIEAGEEVVVPVQRAVCGDVEFGAVQHRDPVAAGHPGQLAALL